MEIIFCFSLGFVGINNQVSGLAGYSHFGGLVHHAWMLLWVSCFSRFEVFSFFLFGYIDS